MIDDTLVSQNETRVSASRTKLDCVQIAVTRFRHVRNWNCLGESAARRPRPHVQRHLSGELTSPSTADVSARASCLRNAAHGFSMRPYAQVRAASRLS
ncbi:hypothetical protein [Streptomyces hilarionis]|uniref:hypothetical protein n=1 Tax=Streptomyces hilarionis TaxID=2839954 RepID=UPI00211A016A|nr:hypothetical protein [Streptomyces hilarionis]MCQ9130013.1 hypothetical protein [Streptomyces hilarionis]